MKALKNPLIALITDFGERDFFVGSIKGVISRINPSSRIIDITHWVTSFDVLAAAFILYAVYKCYPPHTVFLIVVDPGVGSERDILVVQTKEYSFIAPDNGILSLVLEKEKAERMVALTNSQYFLPEQGRTFHGRDRMAPAAAWLSKGLDIEELGQEVSNFYRLNLEKSQRKNNQISGQVLYVDKFGNLITNISSQEALELRKNSQSSSLVLRIRERDIFAYVPSYAFVERGELLFLEGSIGFIEVAVREGSAQKALDAHPGDRVIITSG